jgi:formylglycine-generating enzyme required for sulfatase activity
MFLDETKDPYPKPDGISRPSPPYIDFTLGMGKTGGYPANSMQQYAVIMFCKWLYKKTGNFYRLPTEVEWEYAAKLSYDRSILNINDTLLIDSYEWYSKNSSDKYHKVATKLPSILGLYDLLGNVSEWTLDQYDENYLKILDNGSINPFSKKTTRYPSTVKGGNYKSKWFDLRPSNRIRSNPIWNRRDPQIPKSKWWNADAPFVGFRLVRPYISPSQKEIEQFFENMLK